MKTNRRKRNLSLPALMLGLTVTLPSFAQEPAPDNTQVQRPAETREPQANQDPLENLQLTGEQRAAIRAIRIANRDEQQAVKQRLERAQVALEDALDADYPNEAMIEERAKEVGAAQVAAIRMRALREVRIRRVLTPAQQATLRELRLQAREAAGRRQQDNEGRRRRNLPNQGNGIAPGPALRRNNLPRRP